MTNRRRHGSAPRRFGGALLAVAGLLVPVLAAPAAPAAAHAQPGYGAVAQPPEHGAVAQPTGYGAVAQPAGYGAHQQLDRLGAEAAWQHATGDGVTVAVVDSGVDADHPDLAGRVLPGQDFVASADGRVDPVGHGTTVASLIAGRRGGTAIGLAPDATILPVRVLDDENRYQNAATVAEGVVWAVEQGAHVINLSLGGSGFSPALSDAISLAIARDVVVVACTGNEGEESGTGVWYPAREPGVLAVSGLTWAGRSTPDTWPESLTGPETVLAAPAVVTGAAIGGEQRLAQGTSFSSALVSASAALLRSRWPEMSAANVVNRLVATAEDLGQVGRDPTFGFGAVDPVAALTEPAPVVFANPLDTKARHGTAGFGRAPSSSTSTGPDSPAAFGGDRAPVRTSRPTGTAHSPTGTAHRPAGEAADQPGGAGDYRPPQALIWTLAALVVALLAAAVTIRLRAP